MSSAAGGRRRLALYGGAFDPIHNGHLATIALILNSGAADEVLVIPSGDRPDKPNTIAAQHRMELKLEAHLLIVGRPSVKSSAPELQAEWQTEWRSTVLSAPYEAQVLVSSTTLREIIRSGARCAGLMPKSVYDYCIKHAVYRAF